MKLVQKSLQVSKACWQFVMNRYTAFVLALFGFAGSAWASGGSGPDASKLPDFKVPGVNSNTKDTMEIIFLVAKGLVTLAAVLFAVWCILAVVKALVTTFQAATDPNEKKGWTPFIGALIIGFILIFFCLWLVKMAVGLF